MMALNLKHSCVFKNENKISFINSDLFSFEVAERDLNSINFIVLSAEILMLMSMMSMM